MNDSGINYYEILDVTPKASEQEVYQAYLRIKKAYSLRNPELFKSFSLDEIQQLLLFVEEAYATLGNPRSREVYDAQFFRAPFPQHQQADEILATPLDTEPTAPTTPPKESVKPPEGYGSTSISAYQIDPTFETLIEGQEFFDGMFLGKIRKYKKVKLEDFSQQTCISIRYLYAIENNNYEALPAPVFVRGYINQYCKILGLDADRVIPSFMKLYQNGRS